MPNKAINSAEEDSADDDGDSDSELDECSNDNDNDLEKGEIRSSKDGAEFGNPNTPWFRPSKSPYLYPTHGAGSDVAQTRVLKQFMKEAPMLNRVKNSLCTMLAEINPLYGDIMTLINFQDFVLQNSTELENIQGCMHPYGSTRRTAGCRKRDDDSRNF
ncbi:MAG: hypothetical protein WB421_17825 [Terriglobales bacterium]